METVKNIMIVGVGGQGVVLAGDLLVEAALISGLDVKKSDIHGMAQRGGCVSSHVRFAKKVHSPLIGEGQADLLLAFEPAEALRNIHFLKTKGQAVVNTAKIVPPVVSLGVARYPDEAVDLIKNKFESKIFDAQEIALEIGNPKLVNTILLAAASKWLPFSEDELLQALKDRLPSKIYDINVKAFKRGLELN